MGLQLLAVQARQGGKPSADALADRKRPNLEAVLDLVTISSLNAVTVTKMHTMTLEHSPVYSLYYLRPAVGSDLFHQLAQLSDAVTVASFPLHVLIFIIQIIAISSEDVCESRGRMFRCPLFQFIQTADVQLCTFQYCTLILDVVL